MEKEISTSWHTYPKSLALGHRMVRDILDDEVIVEEKIDGSQFSFGVFNGELKCRSKGCQLNILAPEKMFNEAVAVVKDKACLLKEGWTYRGEYLKKPKHNTLAYDRIPNNHIIGFDINTGHETYLSYEEKYREFARIGLETVPLIHSGKIESYEIFRDLLDRESCLGKQKIEGLVVKNYQKFTPDGKAMLAKFVSEDFKEIHSSNWKEENPSKTDFIERIIAAYCTPARWNKAIYRLRDLGKIEDSPRDIGYLVQEIPNDVKEECETEIKELLWQHFWPHVSRGVVKGFAQYYKESLAKKQFEEIGL